MDTIWALMFLVLALFWFAYAVDENVQWWTNALARMVGGIVKSWFGR
jgi:hypothetical protein